MEPLEKIGGVTLNYSFFDEKDQYNDGDEVEDFLLEVFKSRRNVLQALAEDDRWPVLCHLSPRRGNILTPMAITKAHHVLEIGAGPGAITEPLAKMAGRVDCVELSKRRACINAWRNQDQDNIEIFVGNFEKVSLPGSYDAVLLIGVLEYAQQYVTAENPPLFFLQKVRRLLKPGGRIYIAIENRFGMKYFSGAPEDHFGVPFCGIEGYVQMGDKARTYSRSELQSIVEQAGFSSVYFYYPHPDYKLPVVIYSDDYLPSGSDAIPEDIPYDLPRLSAFHEKRAMGSLAGLQEYQVFANSFLVEAVLD